MDTASTKPLEISRLSADEALELLKKTGTCLCLDVPVNIEFGIDVRSWAVGEKFAGIKMIPPGLHFVFWSVPNKLGGEGSPRMGRFIFFKERQVVVMKWDKNVEDMMLDAQLSSDEVGTLTHAVLGLQFDDRLGAFPAEQSEVWKGLSDHISSGVLARVSPTSGRISSLADELPAGMSDVPARPSTRPNVVTRNPQRLAELINNDSNNETQPTFQEWVDTLKPNFTDIPNRLVPPGCTASELTKHQLDRSYALTTLMRDSFNNDDELLLGELQYAFLTFLVGHSFAGFEQWKRLIVLMCSCEDAMITLAPFYYKFIAVLHLQLEQAPTDFFQDPVSNRNFLVPMLSRLFDNVDTINKTQGDVADQHWTKLSRRVARFQKKAEETFGRQFDSEDDSDGPVIVY